MYQQIFTNQMNTQYQYYQQYYPQYYYHPLQYQFYQSAPVTVIPNKSAPALKSITKQVKNEEINHHTKEQQANSQFEQEKTSESMPASDFQNSILDKSNTLKPNLLVDSTNIQKNFSKAIVQYVLRQKKAVYQLLGEEKGNEFLQFISQLVNQLRNLFHLVKHTQDEDFLRAIRILGNNFLRKESTCYIYNSKIRQKTSHIKHKAIVKKVLMKL